MPINTAYRGNILRHVVQSAASELMVTCADLMPRLKNFDDIGLRMVVEFGESKVTIEGVEIIPAIALWAEGPPPVLSLEIEPWDPQSIIFTSGTTGPSKGVLSSYTQLWETSGDATFSMLEKDDCAMVCGPLFHIAGTVPVRW